MYSSGQPWIARIWSMTAKEKVLEMAPQWSESQAAAALRVAQAQDELTEHFEAEARLTPEQLQARDDRRAEANARALIREEPWQT